MNLSIRSPVTCCALCNKGKIIVDETGESACSVCGYVIPTEMVNNGVEWRTLRTSTLSKFDGGLSTVIGKGSTDANGMRLDAETRQNFQRIQRWDYFTKLSTSENKNLKSAMNFLSRLLDKVHASEVVREDAAYIYRKALSKKLIKGRSINGIAAACVYASYRKHGVATALKNIARLSNMSKIEIATYYRFLLKDLGISMPTIDPISAIPRLASELGIQEKTRRLALNIIEKAKQRGIVAGKNPIGFAAAALYTACIRGNEHVVQDKLAKAAGVTTVTLRKLHNDLKAMESTECIVVTNVA